MVISLRELGYPCSDIKAARNFLFGKAELDPKRLMPIDNQAIVRKFIELLIFSFDGFSPATVSKF
jgi:hypothetical protein